MKIGELAKRTGLTASSIRFYEASGLIEANRRDNGYRDYPEAAVDTLNIIRCGQQLGFSLDEMRGLMPGKPGQSYNHEPLLASLHAKLAEIEALQETLAQRKLQLQTLLARMQGPDGGHVCVKDQAGEIAGDMLHGQPVRRQTA